MRFAKVLRLLAVMSLGAPTGCKRQNSCPPPVVIYERLPPIAAMPEALAFRAGQLAAEKSAADAARSEAATTATTRGAPGGASPAIAAPRPTAAALPTPAAEPQEAAATVAQSTPTQPTSAATTSSQSNPATPSPATQSSTIESMNAANQPNEPPLSNNFQSIQGDPNDPIANTPGNAPVPGVR